MISGETADQIAAAVHMTRRSLERFINKQLEGSVISFKRGRPSVNISSEDFGFTGACSFSRDDKGDIVPKMERRPVSRTAEEIAVQLECSVKTAARLLIRYAREPWLVYPADMPFLRHSPQE